MTEAKNEPLDLNATEDVIEDSSSSSQLRQLEAALEFMREFDAFWKNRLDGIYEAKIELNDPVIVRINHLRQAVRFYLIPFLESALQAEPDAQQRIVKHLPFLFSDKKRDQFFNHFYGVIKSKEKEWNFEERDIFKVDELVLYDLYKVKRTMNGITAMIKELSEMTYSFSSIFSKKKQVQILKGMNSAFFMAFKISVKPQYQVDLFRNINLKLIHEDQINKRRKAKIIYSRIKNPEASPFRRIFLHLLLRNQIKTKIKNRETLIEYSLVDLEQLIEEYFGYFVEDSVEQVEYMQTYHLFHIGGNTFTNSIIESPNPEALLFEEIDEIKTFI